MKTNPVLWITGHCALRMQERGIPHHQLEIVTMFGSRHHVPGAMACFLRRKDMPPWLPAYQARRLEDIVVIIKGGRAITVYRNAKFLRENKRRSPWNQGRSFLSFEMGAHSAADATSAPTTAPPI